MGSHLRASARARDAAWQLLRPPVEHGGVRWPRLAPELLLREARRLAGKERVHVDPEPDPALTLLVASCEAEAGLNLFGRIALRREIVRLLVNRARLRGDEARRAGMAEPAAPPPVVVTGLPGSGAGLLARILALDPAHRRPTVAEASEPVVAATSGARRLARRAASTRQRLQLFQRVAPALATAPFRQGDAPADSDLLFMHAFHATSFVAGMDVPSYGAWLAADSLADAWRWHRMVLRRLAEEAPTERWLLSGPAHLAGLAALGAQHPGAEVVIVHRAPEEALARHAAGVVALRGATTLRMDAARVGPELATRWTAALARACADRAAGRAPHVTDVEWDRLHRAPLETVRELYAGWNRALPPAFAVQLPRLLARLAAERPPAAIAAARVRAGV